MSEQLAHCEPSKSVRDSINTNLNVQGQLICPQSIDMRAILPVYDLHPEAKQPLRAIFNTGLIPIAGFVNYAVQMLPVFPLTAETPKYFVMKNYYLLITINAAGRAALAGIESINMIFNHNIPTGGFMVAYVMARGRQNIRANPGTALLVTNGSFNVSMSSIIAYLIPAWETEIESLKDYQYLPGEFLEVVIGLDAANFPANSTLELSAIFDMVY